MENRQPQFVAVYGLFVTNDRGGSELLGIYTSHVKACLAAKLYLDQSWDEDENPGQTADSVQIRFLDLDQDPDIWFATQARKLPFTYA